jgi:hypothetical protein
MKKVSVSVQFGLCSRLKSHQHFLSVPALITALGTGVNPLSRCTTSIQTKQAGFGHSSKRCWTARSVLPFPSVVDETNWPSQNPLLLKDLYAGIVASEIAAEREDWYNLSDDLIYRAPGVSGDRPKPNEDMSAIEKEAYMSFEHCRRACEEHDRCYQFIYSEQSYTPFPTG